MLEKIKKLCNERGIKIRQLERELGFGRDTIERWDKSIPRADRLAAVAKYFGTTVEQLLKEV